MRYTSAIQTPEEALASEDRGYRNDFYSDTHSSLHIVLERIVEPIHTELFEPFAIWEFRSLEYQPIELQLNHECTLIRILLDDDNYTDIHPTQEYLGLIEILILLRPAESDNERNELMYPVMNRFHAIKEAEEAEEEEAEEVVEDTESESDDDEDTVMD